MCRNRHVCLDVLPDKQQTSGHILFQSQIYNCVYKIVLTISFIIKIDCHITIIMLSGSELFLLCSCIIIIITCSEWVIPDMAQRECLTVKFFFFCSTVCYLSHFVCRDAEWNSSGSGPSLANDRQSKVCKWTLFTTGAASHCSPR